MMRQRTWSTAVAFALMATVAVGGVVAQQRGTRWKLFSIDGGLPATTDTLGSDPAVRELAQIRSSLFQRSFRQGVDRRALVDAYARRDEAAIKELLGMSDAEEAMLANRLNELRDQIVARHPALAELVVTGADCKECYGAQAVERIVKWLERQRPAVRPSTAGQSLQAEMTPDGSSPPLLPEPATGCATDQGGSSSAGGDDGCENLQYIAALLVCTTAGPIFYWACAYVAYCSFCEGGLTDDLCLAEMTVS